MKDAVHQIITVSDQELMEGMRFFGERIKMVVEPTGCLRLMGWTPNDGPPKRWDFSRIQVWRPQFGWKKVDLVRYTVSSWTRDNTVRVLCDKLGAAPRGQYSYFCCFSCLLPYYYEESAATSPFLANMYLMSGSRPRNKRKSSSGATVLPEE